MPNQLRVPVEPPSRGTSVGTIARQAQWSVPAVFLMVYLVTQYAWAAQAPFINEDYAFLDTTRSRSLFNLWLDPALRTGPWFRPWSQGFHYWLCQRMFGIRVEPWHAVSGALALTILVSYFLLIRRAIGRRGAAIATAGAAVMVAWGPLVTWVAGVQDLWMLVFALGMLHSLVNQRPGWATAMFVLALCSKETAAVLPALSVCWLVTNEHRTMRRALLSTLPMWILLAIWATLYPSHGGVLSSFHRISEVPSAGTRARELLVAALLAVLNLDIRPQPAGGWPAAATLAAPGCAALIGFIVWCYRGNPSADHSLDAPATHPSTKNVQPRTGHQVAFGTCWAFLGWAPLLSPALHWHSYYSLLGGLGAWYAIAPLLARWPAVASGVVLCLGTLRAGRSTTVIHDWGEESYLRRAAGCLRGMHADLLAKCPAPAPHTRFYFRDVPSEVGFLVSDGPVIRVWYEDATLQGWFYRDFRAREIVAPPGVDRFFRYDPSVGWVEIVVGAEDVLAAQMRNSRWADDHRRLVLTLAKGGDWTATMAEYSKLASSFPDSASYPYMAGLAALACGDSAAGERLISRAAKLRSADPEIQSAARAIALRSRR